MTYNIIAENLCISIGTVYNIIKLFENTGEVDPKVRQRSEKKLDNYHTSYILGLILSEPATRITELLEMVKEVTGTTVSASTLCRLLAEHGFTRKKIQKVALQRRVDLRAFFVANVSLFQKEMFVFVDETGSNLKDMIRLYGYSFCGERAVSNRLQVRGERVSSIAGICCEGVLAIHNTIGSVNGDIFFDFLRGDLVPQMLPFDGCNPRSIIVMDNCAIHHVQQIIDFVENLGILIIFLPPLQS